MPGTDQVRVALQRALATATTIAGAGALAAGAFAAGSGGIAGGGETSHKTTAKQGSTFPLRSRFDWGDGLGAGRGHQGQDLLTNCRKPVLAAQPGRVKVRGRHGAAGNYVVIDGNGKRKDAVYMHLLRKARVHKGQRIQAGEKIGLVGRSGRATTCHLHFELWNGKGWYEGGRPVNPKPKLRRWLLISKRR